MLSIPTTMKSLNGDQAKCFHSVQLRQDVRVEHMVIPRSPAQWCFEIVAFRNRQKVGGKVPGADKLAKLFLDNVRFSPDEEQMSKTFIDNCLTVHDRMLQNDQIRSSILYAENKWGKKSPLDSVNKLHIIIFKARMCYLIRAASGLITIC